MVCQLIEGQTFRQIAHDGGKARALQNALLVARLLEECRTFGEARGAADTAILLEFDLALGKQAATGSAHAFLSSAGS